MRHLVQAVGAVVVGIMLSVSLVGCGGGDAGPKIVPVTGTVVHDGKPLAGVQVFFHGDAGPLISLGEADENGHFVMTTDTTNPGDGTYVGNNRLSFRMAPKMIRRDGKQMGEDFQPKSPMHGAMMFKSVKTVAVDRKYGRPETSGIALEVVDGGENHFDIVLE